MVRLEEEQVTCLGACCPAIGIWLHGVFRFHTRRSQGLLLSLAQRLVLGSPGGWSDASAIIEDSSRRAVAAISAPVVACLLGLLCCRSLQGGFFDCSLPTLSLNSLPFRLFILVAMSITHFFVAVLSNANLITTAASAASPL